MKREPLTLKDFRLAVICFLVGGAMATGLLCLFLGLFYNTELNSVMDVIDKR